GGTLLVIPEVIVGISIPAPLLALPAPIPYDCAFSGLSIYLQVLELDPGASQGVSFTPGLKLVLGF
ncbi:MAG: hypothetical protein AB1486_28805, partial [Planctomycetota bacterium]